MKDLENRFIVFNGAMASGKTTQTELIAQRFGCVSLHGEESEHPSIVNGEVYTLGSDVEVEKWFLNFHLGKLASLGTLNPPEGLVSDVSVQNDLIFGRALLKGSQLEEFEDYYESRVGEEHIPDLAILFVLPPKVLLQRVRRRIKEDPNRVFEIEATEEFIEVIQDSFIQNQRELARDVKVLDLRKKPDIDKQEVADLVADIMNDIHDTKS